MADYMQIPSTFVRLRKDDRVLSFDLDDLQVYI